LLNLFIYIQVFTYIIKRAKLQALQKFNIIVIARNILPSEVNNKDIVVLWGKNKNLKLFLFQTNKKIIHV